MSLIPQCALLRNFSLHLYKYIIKRRLLMIRMKKYKNNFRIKFQRIKWTQSMKDKMKNRKIDNTNRI